MQGLLKTSAQQKKGQVLKKPVLSCKISAGTVA